MFTVRIYRPVTRAWESKSIYFTDERQASIYLDDLVKLDSGISATAIVPVQSLWSGLTTLRFLPTSGVVLGSQA